MDSLTKGICHPDHTHPSHTRRGHNTGPDQQPGLIVMSLSDMTAVDLDPDHEYIVVLINANDEAQTFTTSDLAGLNLSLHLVQAASVDPVVQASTYDNVTGAFEVPGRTTAVFVQFASAEEMIQTLKGDVQTLIDDGLLAANKANVLFTFLNNALKSLENDKPAQAIGHMEQFIKQVEMLVKQGELDPQNGAILISDAEAIIAAIEAGN